MRRLTKNMPPEKGRHGNRGLILFLRYDPEKSAKVYEDIVTIRRRGTAVRWTLVHIDNRDPGCPWQRLDNAEAEEYWVGGDNTDQEFSGWDRGWREAQAHLRHDFRVILIVNDALRNSKPIDQLRYLDNHILRYLKQYRAAAGWVDTFSRVAPDPIDAITKPMRVFDHRLRRYVCTTFIAFSRDVFEAVCPLACEVNEPEIYFDRYNGTPFRPDCGLGSEYQDFLLQHQTRKWYKRYTLDATTYDTFKNKTRMIILEHALGGRLLKSRAKLLSLYALSQKSRIRTKIAKKMEKRDLLRFSFLSLWSSLYSWREIAMSTAAFYARKLRLSGKTGADPA